MSTESKSSANAGVPSATECGYYLNMTELGKRSTPPSTARETAAAVATMLRERLPPDWTVAEAPTDSRTPQPDAVLALTCPGGPDFRIILETKILLEARDVPQVREQLSRHIRPGTDDIGLVTSRYLAKSTRDSLSKAGLSYADATGNILIRAHSAPLFISDRGADSDPWRGPGRPRATLKGAPAAKVVRTLLDLPGPWRISDLVRQSATSTGSVYRVMEFLESEALATREGSGSIIIPDWTALLRRWSDDYTFLNTNVITRWIAPRGLENFLDRVRQSQMLNYAITGSIAAATWAPYAPARSAMIFSSSTEEAAAALGLRPTDTGANVLLAKPAYDVLIDRAIDREDGLRIAAPAQVAADLMTGPGRAPSEAEELLDWMRRNEQLWR